MAVFLITGVSASGKSTVAELLASRFSPSAHVRGDAFRRMLVHPRFRLSPSHPDEVVEALRLRYRQAGAVVDLFHSSGHTVVVQDVAVGPVLASFVSAITARPLHVVVLAPRRDVVEAREAGRAKAAYGAGQHSLASLDDALRHSTPRIGLWLDTSNQTPDETVDEILSRSDEALVVLDA